MNEDAVQIAPDERTFLRDWMGDTEHADSSYGRVYLCGKCGSMAAHSTTLDAPDLTVPRCPNCARPTADEDLKSEPGREHPLEDKPEVVVLDDERQGSAVIKRQMSDDVADAWLRWSRPRQYASFRVLEFKQGASAKCHRIPMR